VQEVVKPDWECFARARQGDETAWRALVARHQPRLAALAFFITRSIDAADDVVQETFVRALGARVSHSDGTVQGFLSTIAYRLALKEAQQTRRTVNLDTLDLPDDAQNALGSVLANERDCLVVEAIESLDAEHRDVLILRFYGDCSYAEIAGLLAAPLGTVKSRIFYAVRSCRETLRKKGVFDEKGGFNEAQ
jgi:RNA polymerase sigma-70 factor (ECF subfamily)